MSIIYLLAANSELNLKTSINIVLDKQAAGDVGSTSNFLQNGTHVLPNSPASARA